MLEFHLNFNYFRAMNINVIDKNYLTLVCTKSEWCSGRDSISVAK